MMVNSLLMERLHFVKGIDPVADFFAGTVYSDIVNLQGYDRVCFVIFEGVSTGGTDASTITVEASDDTSGSNVSAVPFHYRAITTGDTEGAITAVASTGFATTAGSSQVYAVEIDAQALIASGYKYCRLKAVETGNDPVVGTVLIIMDGVHYGKGVKETAIV